MIDDAPINGHADGVDFGGESATPARHTPRSAPGSPGWRPTLIAARAERDLIRPLSKLDAALRRMDRTFPRDVADMTTARAELRAAALGIARAMDRADNAPPTRELEDELTIPLDQILELDAIAERDATPATPAAAKPARPRIEVRRLYELAPEIVAQSKIPTLDYGIAALNRLAPLPLRAMATLFGPTGAGKTSLAMTIAAHRARYARTPGATQGPVVYLQLELTPAQLAARRASQVTPYSWRQILGGALAEAEVASALAGEHFYVVKVDRKAPFLEQAREALDAVAAISPGIPLLVVDYLQRIKGPGRDVRDSMTNVVDEIVDLVESRDMFALVLSKGSRNGSRTMRDGKTRGEALVDGAAETSAIEAGSAVVLAITYDNRDGQDTTDTRLEIAKARYGVTGAAIGMRFHGASGRWEELTEAPLPKAERDIADKVIATVSETPEGFESRAELLAAMKERGRGCNKQAALALIARELGPDGRLEIRNERIHLRRVGL